MSGSTSSQSLVVQQRSAVLQPWAQTTVKRDGAEVAAVFRKGARIRDILLDFAGPVGSETYKRVLNVILSLEELDETKGALQEEVVFFPGTGEGCVNLTTWMRYMTTVRADHFCRELKKLTSDIHGRIEIQVKQVSGTQFYKRTTFVDPGTNEFSPNFGETYLY